jgi:hypothetical protein
MLLAKSSKYIANNYAKRMGENPPIVTIQADILFSLS